ncbi:MAG: hypothetical protein HOP07_11250 [Bacteriovoracaceae bacterium]|nr:hypothetical protein [Bacteriovoracaceae bacterium]
MSKKSYFQYQKDLNLPVFIAIDLEVFDSGMSNFFTEMKFQKLTDKEIPLALDVMKKNNKSRCLSISEASPSVSRQIQGSLESDHYGQESVVRQAGYQVYRYKEQGLMVYSFGAKVWEFGCYSHFGSAPDAASKLAARIIMNRFLTWALIPQGILGLWGVAVEGGVVLQRPRESRGELVFIDVIGNKILSMDGNKKLGPKFKVLRLDPTLKGRNVKMSHEELLGFMSAHATYLDINGLSVPVRQMIQTLARMTEGLLHPEESFRPRTDLSL